jgi:KDO2-lipid IV(A) lauroyltransferase
MRSLLVRILFAAIAALPLSLLRGLGRIGGALVFRYSKRERRNAQINLRLCFSELSDQERTNLLRETLRENVITLLEMVKAWHKGPDYWAPKIDANGADDAMRAHLAKGKGLILAAPHLGSWEIGSTWISRIAPTTTLYRPPRQSSLEKIMVRGRSRSGATLVPTTLQGIKALYKALMNGEMVAILPDQQPKQTGAAGAFGPFFGKPALTMTLVNRLSHKTGAPVMFLFLARQSDGGYRCHYLDADPAVADKDPTTAVTALNRGVEACVRQYPSQYQWTYKRFHDQPDGASNPYRQAV